MKPLQAKGISVQQASHLVLDNIHLDIQAGEVMALLGANGAGKSTLLGCLAGDILDMPITTGEVLLDEQNIQTLSSSQLAKHRAVLTQHPSLNFDLSVDEVIEMGSYPFPELSHTEVATLKKQALEWIDIQHLQQKRYQALSGGEKQMVQFARILVQLFAQQQSARYCLLDEPTSHLDPKNQRLLLQVLRRVATELNIGIMIILHDVNLAALYCDKLALLAKGKLIAQGSATTVLTPDNLEAIYGVPGQTIPHPIMENKILVVWS
ncbi:MAG: heme ABC transporter ATP-binding protein [Pelistega sp.]|nr:heme ABC transporter ATP-binding protein [Pelistega sp.]